MRWLASVSSLARMTSPSRAAVAFSRIGVSARHGAHHSAQKSTTTGISCDFSMTCCWKSCSVTSMTAMSPRVRRAMLYVERSGDGPTHPPVVLLHGLTATHKYVVMGSKSLQRAGHDVVAYDARGHGAS